MEYHTLTNDDLNDIQAGPVAAISTKKKTFFFFQICDVEGFRKAFRDHLVDKITSSNDARDTRAWIKDQKKKAVPGIYVFPASLNIAFSYSGLQKLFSGVNIDEIGDKPFIQGQLARAESELGDDLGTWTPAYKEPIDGVFIITGCDDERITEKVTYIKDSLGSSIKTIYQRDCSERPGNNSKNNHFGWFDGFSSIFIKYFDDAEKKRFPYPGQDVVNPKAVVIRERHAPEWAKNGSLIAFRDLQLLVPEWDKYLFDEVMKWIFDTLPHTADNGTEIQRRIELLGARFNGRWKSGAPLVLAPYQDDPDLGRDLNRNNNFRDHPVDQFFCPFAAHTRKTGPRSDFKNSGDIERHSIVRGGLHYGVEVTDEERNQKKTIEERGLAFACYQSSLDNGFEHMQKRCNDPKDPISGNTNSGLDPLIGQGVRNMTGYDMSNLEKELVDIPTFSVVLGGGYFFLPSLTTLKNAI